MVFVTKSYSGVYESYKSYSNKSYNLDSGVYDYLIRSRLRFDFDRTSLSRYLASFGRRVSFVGVTFTSSSEYSMFGVFLRSVFPLHSRLCFVPF